VDYHSFYYKMADGTVKQVNPFTGIEVWTVSERGNRSITDAGKEAAEKPIVPHNPEDHCSFCETRYFETAPEKARIIHRDGEHRIVHHLPRADYFNDPALFRRVSNLFEIVSINYWRKNYDYKLSPKNQLWKEEYLSTPEGLQHALDVLEFKLKRSGKSDEEIAAIAIEDKFTLADAFFGGGHELIIAQRHYRPGARFANDLFATGDMSDEEHYQYFRFIIDAMVDTVENNRYVRYLSVFKNWLKPAGASFDHLHTQIVAIDEWGASIERQIEMIKKDKNYFNVFGPNFAGLHNLVFAENEHALAFVGIGHRYPTVEIYSKSVNARPYEHTPDEVRGISDLVRVCHAAIGGRVSVNEEWYYTPIDCIFKMPWHINIKLRINVPAGFEGGTSIFINPLMPEDLRDKLVPKLYQLRAEGRCSPDIHIAEECRVLPNPLNYHKNS
jgi:galactose-1-phosphate uridylyltransferase